MTADREKLFVQHIDRATSAIQVWRDGEEAEDEGSHWLLAAIAHTQIALALTTELAVRVLENETGYDVRDAFEKGLSG